MKFFQLFRRQPRLFLTGFTVIFIFFLSGNGCGQTPSYNDALRNYDGHGRIINASATNTLPITTTTPEEQKRLLDFFTTNYFNKKIIPFDTLSAFGTNTKMEYRPDVDTYNQNDCLGILGGKTLGGDLLTTFVDDGRFKEAIEYHYANSRGITSSPFTYYTTSYIKKIQDITTNFIKIKYHTNFYSYYVCHLGESLDVVAGSLWDPDTSPYYFNNNVQGVDTLAAFSSSTIVLIIKKNRVKEFNTLQTVNHTGTGAETYPCQASLKNNEIVWTCFSRLVRCSEHAGTRELYTWILRFNGTRSGRITTLKPSCREAEKAYNMNQ